MKKLPDTPDKQKWWEKPQCKHDYKPVSPDDKLHCCQKCGHKRWFDE